MTARVTVKCPPCGWSGLRLEASATTTPCPRCGATVEIGLLQRGRPPLPPDQRRCEIQVRPLESTFDALDAAGAPRRAATTILDEWARGLPRATPDWIGRHVSVAGQGRYLVVGLEAGGVAVCCEEDGERWTVYAWRAQLLDEQAAG